MHGYPGSARFAWRKCHLNITGRIEKVSGLVIQEEHIQVETSYQQILTASL
jgi:hypothetical protein